MGREENVSNLSDTPYAQPPQWEIKQLGIDFQCTKRHVEQAAGLSLEYSTIGLWNKQLGCL